MRKNIEFFGSSWNPTSSRNFAGGLLDRSAVQKKARIRESAIILADNMYTRLNKGQMSDKKIKMMIDELAITPNLSKREALGRIEATERIFDLPIDASAESVRKAGKIILPPESTGGTVKPGSKGKISPEKLDSILEEVGNDPEEAKKLAKERGYTW